jgi:hypothetical protein
MKEPFSRFRTLLCAQHSAHTMRAETVSAADRSCQVEDYENVPRKLFAD